MGLENLWKKIKEGPIIIIDEEGVPRVGDKEGWEHMEKLTLEQLARMRKDAIALGLTEEEYQRREDLMKKEQQRREDLMK